MPRRHVGNSRNHPTTILKNLLPEVYQTALTETDRIRQQKSSEDTNNLILYILECINSIDSIAGQFNPEFVHSRQQFEDLLYYIKVTNT